MLGALYLSYGQHRIAGEVFEQVLAQSVDPVLHDRAWFFLAKIPGASDRQTGRSSCTLPATWSATCGRSTA
jgi:hypothetical protein